MESITIFLASLWGPAILAVGIGFFVSKDHYIRIYRDIEKGSLALFIFAIVGIAAGIAQISAHNVWGTFPEIVISLLGWGLLVKATIFAIKPSMVDSWGNVVAASKMTSVAGMFCLILGAYLSWLAFM